MHYHPLLYHLIDVGIVAKSLCLDALDDSFISRFQESLGLKTADQTANLLSFWVALHDIGKAAPVFQQKAPNAKEELARQGFDFSALLHRSIPHGTITPKIIQDQLASLEKIFKIDSSLLLKIGISVGGHHGIFPRISEFIGLASATLGFKSIWKDSIAEIIQDLGTVFGVENLNLEGRLLNESDLVLLAGLTTVSDWIGSSEQFFPFETKRINCLEYASLAGEKAKNALASIGWTKPPSISPKTFPDLFPYCKNSRPLQKVAVDNSEKLKDPSLIIIEAPMGEGKTEAGLFLADHLISHLKHSGFYAALPTTATSNQMFSRILAFLENRFGGSKTRVNFQLIHGQAVFSEAFASLSPNAIGGLNETQDNVFAEEWFMPRKRSLLASFGVGTVDQILMATLQTRHGFVRLFGLANKVVIIDEIHAYDAYMGSLILKLLQWLKTLGSSVILMSATLPTQTRESIINAWGANVPPWCAYPRITMVSGAKEYVFSVPNNTSRSLKIDLNWVDHEILVENLKLKSKQGGCILIVCNTVKNAQNLYQKLCPVFPENLMLFHARFPLDRRLQIEKMVVEKFGKNRIRPGFSILIATQVVEQSLDLDFDYLLTELAPVDLILQRTGRLHRHGDILRPSGLENPAVAVIKPEIDKSGLPFFGVSERIYPKFLLLKTWWKLKDKQFLNIPEDIESLVESVYDNQIPEIEFVGLLECFRDNLSQLAERIRQKETLAESISIPPPVEGLFNVFNRELNEDEDPSVHKDFQALTRDAEPAVTVILLKKNPSGNLFPYCSPGLEIGTREKYAYSTLKALLGSSVQITHKGIVPILLETKPYESFLKSPGLRFARPICLDGQNSCFIGNYVLKVDDQLGVMIESNRE